MSTNEKMKETLTTVHEYNNQETNQIQVFSNDEFGSVRTVTINDEVWFVGKDVATALGYSNTKDALIRHVASEDRSLLQKSQKVIYENHIPKEVFPVDFVMADIPNRGLTIINESGLYSLILSSKLSRAKKFKHWITNEVLPFVCRHDRQQSSALSITDDIVNINGVECYEKDGVVYLKLEAVARGLGFTEFKDGNQYVKWRRVDSYLNDFGFDTSGERPDFIPENIFYRLAMKAKNAVAEAFQAKVADEIIPSIRKHNVYMTPEALEKAFYNPEFLIRVANVIKEEREKNQEKYVLEIKSPVVHFCTTPKSDKYPRNLI